MTKQRFAEILLSRFIQSGDLNQHHIAVCLHVANYELQDVENAEDDESFFEWAKTIKEGLFPEEIGELKQGPMPDWNDDDGEPIL